MAQNSLRRRRRLNDAALKKLMAALAAVICALLIFTVAAVCICIAAKGGDAERVNGMSGASLNILLFASGDDSDEPKAFVLCRLDTAEEKIYVTSLPPDTAAEYGGRQSTLAGHMKYGGRIQAQKAVESLFDIEIDRYMSIRLGDFEVLVDTVGGIIFDVPAEVTRRPADGIPITVEPGLQTLTGPQAGAVFAGGGDGAARYTVQENLVCAALCQYLTEDALGNADTYFKTAAALSETDLSPADVYSALPFLAKMTDKADAVEAASVYGDAEQRDGAEVFVTAADSVSAMHTTYTDAE